MLKEKLFTELNLTFFTPVASNKLSNKIFNWFILKFFFPVRICPLTKNKSFFSTTSINGDDNPTSLKSVFNSVKEYFSFSISNLKFKLFALNLLKKLNLVFLTSPFIW